MKHCFLFYSKGPLEFVEPDLSSLPPPRPMSPDATANDKRDSISDKAKQGRLEEMTTHYKVVPSYWLLILLLYNTFINVPTARKERKIH